MTYNEIFAKRNIAANIPLVLEGRELSPAMKAKVMLARVPLDNAIGIFEKDMQEILKGLKKDGFDERSQKIQKMEDTDKRRSASESWKEGDVDKDGKSVEKPSMPTDEELKEADTIRETKSDYNKELAELNEAYMKAHQEKIQEEMKVRERLFTESDFTDLIDFLGTENSLEIKINGEKVVVDKLSFVGMIANSLVEV